MKNKLNQPIEEKCNWQEEFDKKFLIPEAIELCCGGDFCEGHSADVESYKEEHESIKSFIENLLEQERKRMSDEIEKLKLEVPNPYGDWVRVPRVNMLLDKAKAIINK